MWRESEETCPKCNKVTEEYIQEETTEWGTDEFTHAERCNFCKWQVNFIDTVQKVPYGSPIN